MSDINYVDIDMKALQNENNALKRKISLLEINLTRTKQIEAKMKRTESILDLSLKKEQQYFQLVLENMINLLLLLDYDGRIAYASKTFLDVIEIANFGLIDGMDYRDVLQNHIDQGTLKLISSNVCNAIQKNEIITFEDQFDFNFKKDPHIYTVNIISMKFNDQHTGTMIIFNDITDIYKARRSAEYANQAKSNFLATMSHEIRTPLNAIICITNILMQKENIKGDMIDSLERIYKSSESLLCIINDILDLSKIETGKMELKPTAYNMPSFLNDTIQLNIVRIGSKPVVFHLEISEDLPSTLIGDELRLKQILNNILSNAIKYTDKGYVKMTINHEADLEKREINLVFKIKDTGQGINEDDQPKLFSNYLRFNTGQNKYTEGTGIGLRITQNLVKMMQGYITLESVLGEGSTFTIVVKQELVACKPIGPMLAKKLMEFSYKDENSAIQKQIIYEQMPYGSVLIVDDMESNLFVTEEILRLYKIKIDKATNGSMVIEKVDKGNKYDIIFMDHMMPIMDGMEATKVLRSKGYKGVIIALTANALVGNETIFLENGFDGFISKPIDLKQIDEVLHKYISEKYHEESKKYKTLLNNDNPILKNIVDTKLFKLFCADTIKAMSTMQSAILVSDYKIFTINAHAMKSLLLSIDEKEYSLLAAKLEEAGLKRDLIFINNNFDHFMSKLTVLVKRIVEKLSIEEENVVLENTKFLSSKLSSLIEKCKEYDDVSAYLVLDELSQERWSNNTQTRIDEIRDVLFLHSDFDEAVRISTSLLNNIKN